jgi:hypothetical protein
VFDRYDALSLVTLDYSGSIHSGAIVSDEDFGWRGCLV